MRWLHVRLEPGEGIFIHFQQRFVRNEPFRQRQEKNREEAGFSVIFLPVPRSGDLHV